VAGNENEGESGDARRTRHVTARRTPFAAGGVGGVATQVGTWLRSISVGPAPERSLGGLFGRISPVFIVEVGVHTGDALIGGMGRKPEMVSLWSLDAGELRSERRSRMDGVDMWCTRAKVVALILTSLDTSSQEA
jgi:hypothetical protein